MTRKLLAACILWGVGSLQVAVTEATAKAERVAAPTAATSAPATGQHAPRGTSANSQLAAKVQRVLDSYYQRPLDTRQESPWSLLHWAIAYGADAQVLTDGPAGQRVTAIRWLCCNGKSAGKQLIQTRGNQLSLPIAPGLQGHHGQFLTMLAQSGVSESHELRVNGRQLQVSDLIEHEKRTCRSGMELTFKLIGISHYTPSEQVWKNQRGEKWNVRRLLVEELRQPIDRMTCCCGGTHRLFAWSYAVDRRRAEGKPLNGPWATAASRERYYQRRAFQLQNREGNFSTLWMERAENRPDLTRRLLTTGHLLEWLAFSLPDNQMTDPRFERAVNYVADVLERNQQKRWHRGALGHSLHALSIYEQRVLGATPGERLAPPEIARPIDGNTTRGT